MLWSWHRAGSNLIDHLTICSELKFKKLIFVGAVEVLKEEFEVGDLCAPSYSVAGVFANAYLCEKLSDYKPFGKVYPDEKYVDEVIELAKLFEVPAVALLIVSDNSAMGQPLLGRNDKQQKKYNDGRKMITPDLIYQIVKKEN